MSQAGSGRAVVTGKIRLFGTLPVFLVCFVLHHPQDLPYPTDVRYHPQFLNQIHRPTG